MLFQQHKALWYGSWAAAANGNGVVHVAASPPALVSWQQEPEGGLWVFQSGEDQGGQGVGDEPEWVGLVSKHALQILPPIFGLVHILMKD